MTIFYEDDFLGKYFQPYEWKYDVISKLWEFHRFINYFFNA